MTMFRWSTMRTAFLLLVALISLPIGGCAKVGSSSVDDATVTSIEDRGPVSGFATDEHLREHFSKHGFEFGSITQEEYLRRAVALRDAPLGGPILQLIRADEVRCRFNQTSGEFIAFGQDRTILTFFRPNDGERYFRRQATRPR